MLLFYYLFSSRRDTGYVCRRQLYAEGTKVSKEPKDAVEFVRRLLLPRVTCRYERFIRPAALRFKKANVTHPELATTFHLEIIGVKKNPSSQLYTQASGACVKQLKLCLACPEAHTISKTLICVPNYSCQLCFVAAWRYY